MQMEVSRHLFTKGMVKWLNEFFKLSVEKWGGEKKAQKQKQYMSWAFQLGGVALIEVQSVLIVSTIILLRNFQLTR